jgi:hypothetical protein
MPSLLFAFLALLAAAAAFSLSGSYPRDVATCPAPRAASPKLADLDKLKNFDAALDNPDVPDDASLQPARKCSFCFG